MPENDIRDKMMAYLDGELSAEEKHDFERHLCEHPEYKKELDELREIKCMTDSMQFVEPEDAVWDQYWNHIYNRLERFIGWILLSLAAIILIGTAGLLIIRDYLGNPDIPMVLKVGLVAMVLGFAVLFVSVLREKLYFHKKDRYKNIRR
jgi:predicted anti-sigma-YlaC factor YlaD